MIETIETEPYVCDACGAISALMPMTERYQDAPRDERVAAELELIRSLEDGME